MTELEELKTQAGQLIKRLRRLANIYIVLSILLILSGVMQMYRTAQAERALTKYEEGLNAIIILRDKMTKVSNELDSIRDARQKELEKYHGDNE